MIRLAYNNMTGENLESNYPHDKWCNTTFAVDEPVSGSGTNTTPTTSGSGNPLGPTSIPETADDGSSLGGSLDFVFLMAVVTTTIY